MKLKLMTFILIAIIISCQNPENEELKQKISDLEELNNQLIDSINKFHYKRLISSDLIGIPDKIKLTPNQKNTFTFIFPSNEKIPAYNLYKIVTTDDNEETEELIYENRTISRFKYDFIPKSDSDKSFKLLAVFDLDSVRLHIPGHIDMSLSE